MGEREMTMVERVGKAIQARSRTAGQTGALRTMPLSDRVVRELAKVAIEAMREPTIAMIKAGVAAGSSRVVMQWQTLIDAALSETPAKEP